MVKFGKDLQDERISKWENEYLDYKALKFIIREEEFNLESDNKEIFRSFDLSLEKELEKINKFYKENIGLLSSELDDIVITIDNELTDDDKQEIKKSIQDFYNKIDEFRHFILLNVIALIKIIKKRNKKAFNVCNDITHTDHNIVLNSQSFYNSEELLSIFETLKSTNSLIPFERRRLHI